MHLWSKEMREVKHKRNPTSRSSANTDPEQDLGTLEREIQLLRSILHRSAERPDFFWKRQRNAIMASMEEPAPARKGRPIPLWAPVALGVILSILFFVESSKAPPPDFAAGSDQDLLIGIERALSRDYPEAFDAAVVISSNGIIERNQSGRK
jgi:hypothetical protein